MVRRFVMGAVAVVMFGASAQVAQGQLPIRFGIAGGVSAPAGDIADVTNTGFNVTLFTELKPMLLPFGIRVEGAWNQFGFDKDKTGPIDGNARILSLTANGIVDIPSSTLLKFYGIGGVGLYRARSAADVGGGTFEVESANKFGFNVGGGLKLPLPLFQPFVEVRYHKVTDSNASFVPVTFGIKF
jgi:opacity protein-like surface antigen